MMRKSRKTSNGSAASRLGPRITGAASPEQLAARERLPSKASFVRLRFPAGTESLTDVKASLKQLPEVDKAEWVPRAAPPMALAAPVPTDPLIGPATGPIVADPDTQLEAQWYLHRTRVRRPGDIRAAPTWWSRTSTGASGPPTGDFRRDRADLQRRVRTAMSSRSERRAWNRGARNRRGAGQQGRMAGYAPEATLWAIQGDSPTSPGL